jgi:hypothetical protein
MVVLLFAFGASEVLALHVEMFVEKIKSRRVPLRGPPAPHFYIALVAATNFSTMRSRYASKSLM